MEKSNKLDVLKVVYIAATVAAVYVPLFAQWWLEISSIGDHHDK